MNISEYLYVACVEIGGERLTKIGVSLDPMTRACCLEGTTLDLWVSGAPTPLARAYESHILRASTRHHGEYVHEDFLSRVRMARELIRDGISQEILSEIEAGECIRIDFGDKNSIPTLAAAKAAFEAKYIAAALATHCTVAATAEALGKNRTELYRLISRHRLR